MDRNICIYYNTKNGCWNGKRCPFIHKKIDKSELPKCKFFRGPGTCMYGEDCYFRHDISAPIEKSKDKQPKTAATVTKPVEKSEPVEGAVGGCSSGTDIKDQQPEKEKSQSKSNTDLKTSRKSPKSKEKYLSVKVNSKVKKDSTPIKSAKMKVEKASGDSNNNAVDNVEESEATPENRTITCGECGLVIIEDQPPDDEDDEDYLSSLELHYKEKFLKLDKEHLSFLTKDPRFQLSTSCGVCGKDFVRVKSLLSHIVDKVKSKKYDWKMHDSFLNDVIAAFWERDIGISDEEDMMDWLMLHLVESYEGKDTDNSDDDSDNINDIDALFGLMVLSKHLNGASHFLHDSDDDSDYGNPWGMDDDDMFELACQGIKPWDPEAGAALAVLNGEDYY